jgi:ribosome-associated protein
LRCKLKALNKAHSIVSVLEDKKAEKILLLDIHESASFTDYFIICNGTSDRMLFALAAAVREYAKSELQEPVEIEGDPRDGWLVVDVGDVVVHLFSPELRDYYKLDQLWEKGKRLLSLQ